MKKLALLLTLLGLAFVGGPQPAIPGCDIWVDAVICSGGIVPNCKYPERAIGGANWDGMRIVPVDHHYIRLGLGAGEEGLGNAIFYTRYIPGEQPGITWHIDLVDSSDQVLASVDHYFTNQSWHTFQVPYNGSTPYRGARLQMRGVLTAQSGTVEVDAMRATTVSCWG